MQDKTKTSKFGSPTAELIDKNATLKLNLSVEASALMPFGYRYQRSVVDTVFIKVGSVHIGSTMKKNAGASLFEKEGELDV